MKTLNGSFKIFQDLNVCIINYKKKNYCIDNSNFVHNMFKKYNLNIIEPLQNENGEIDIIKTHQNCVIESQKKSFYMTLIISDDIILNENFEYLFNNVYDLLCVNNEWKIYLGGCSRIKEKNIVDNLTYNNINFFKIKDVNCYHFIIYNNFYCDEIINFNNANLITIESFWKYNNLSIITSIPFLSNQSNTENHTPNKLIMENEKILFKYVFLKNDIMIYIIDTGNYENLKNILNIFGFLNIKIINHNHKYNLLHTHIKCIKNSKYLNFNKIYIISDECFFKDNILGHFEKINIFLNEYDNWNMFCGIFNDFDNFDKINIYEKINFNGTIFLKMNNISNIDFVCYNKNIYDLFINHDSQSSLDYYDDKLNVFISIPFICYDKLSMNNHDEKNIVNHINNKYNINFFVINMKIAHERMEQIYKSFKKFNVIRVEAITHEYGWKGCFLSHLKCLEYAKINKLKYIWVLEDDCSPCPNFIDRFNTVNQYLTNNDNWNLYLGGCTKITNDNIINFFSYENEKFIEINYSNCMHMVCYNEKIYDLFLKLNFNHIKLNQEQINEQEHINNMVNYKNILIDNKNSYVKKLNKKKINYINNTVNYIDKPIDEIWHNFTTSIVSVPFLAYQNSSYSYINKKPLKYYRSLKSTEKNCIEFIEKCLLN